MNGTLLLHTDGTDLQLYCNLQVNKGGGEELGLVHGSLLLHTDGTELQLYCNLQVNKGGEEN